ncbi:DUF2304 domain-containing protein [Lachnoclostridium edouardi]|uniref:DUF2304 domain-containing protein n=1 Tax=Lachnoclostridium edouardi TaxID=1926283 RepID=UPI001FA82A4F|nr:DUF2304 domain-containing protein [Lachnoclostridium edouardi]
MGLQIPVMLRIVLILASLGTGMLMIHKIRQSKVQIEDSLFWVFMSAILMIFSLFPGIALWLSNLVGTYSTSNFIFLFVIFLLLVKVFSMTIRISLLEAKLRELVQRVALDQERSESKSGDEKKSCGEKNKEAAEKKEEIRK